jgi:hypothetical protein
MVPGIYGYGVNIRHRFPHNTIKYLAGISCQAFIFFI